MMHNEILIYQQDGHEIEVRLDSQQEALWLSQKQMAELDSAATIRKFRIVRPETYALICRSFGKTERLNGY